MLFSIFWNTGLITWLYLVSGTESGIKKEKFLKDLLILRRVNVLSQLICRLPELLL